MTAELPADEQTVLRVPVSAVGQRLDRFLMDQHPEVSRTAILRVIAQGRATINGRQAPKGTRLQLADRVCCPNLAPAKVLPNRDIQLSIAYADDALLVVDKPSGLPCHPLQAGEQRTMMAGLLASYPQLAAVGDDPRELGLVHRLDTETSGLVLVALTTRALQGLRAQLQQGVIDKRYAAQCSPNPGAQFLLGEHHAYLHADHRRRVGIVAEARPDARPITTVIERGETLADGTMLVHCAVRHAGRHQVRAHLSALGFPLLGDPLYGGPPGASGHLLHATAIGFRHPESAAWLRIESPLPPRFAG